MSKINDDDDDDDDDIIRDVTGRQRSRHSEENCRTDKIKSFQTGCPIPLFHPNFRDVAVGPDRRCYGQPEPDPYANQP